MANPVEGQPVTGADDQGKPSGGTKPDQSVEVPEYLKGNVTQEQYAKLTDEQREWAKELYGDYTRKSQEVAELRRIQEQLDGNPEMAEALKQVVNNPDLAKAILKGDLTAKHTATDQATKDELDTVLEEATPAQRKVINSLIERAAKQAVSVSHAKIAELEQTVKALVSETGMSRRETLEQGLATLTGAFKILGEKYRESILRLGTQPGLTRYSAEQLLQIATVSNPDEYRKALLAQAPEQTKREAEKARQTATTKPSTAVVTSEAGEPARVPTRDARFKKGPIDVGKALQGVFEIVKRGMGGA